LELAIPKRIIQANQVLKVTGITNTGNRVLSAQIVSRGPMAMKNNQMPRIPKKAAAALLLLFTFAFLKLIAILLTVNDVGYSTLLKLFLC
jgi:hypothetical protein